MYTVHTTCTKVEQNVAKALAVGVARFWGGGKKKFRLNLLLFATSVQGYKESKKYIAAQGTAMLPVIHLPYYPACITVLARI